MLTRYELESAIAECEGMTPSYQMCEKLATFYTIFDHLFTEKADRVETAVQEVVGDYGDSDFLRAVRGKRAGDAWALMDELVQAVAITNPRLYNGIMARL